MMRGVEQVAGRVGLGVPHVVLALILVVGLLTTEYVVAAVQQRFRQEQEATTLARLSTIRARLEGEINSTLHLTRGLIGYAATHPNLTAEEFEPLAAEIVAVGRDIRNIALAPDNVIRFMYPLLGNERAIGVRYEEVPDQWPAVKHAIDQGSTVVAGPVKLIQGGTGFIARTPVFVHRSSDTPGEPRKYWGLASIVIDEASLYRATGVSADFQGLRIAIRGKDGKGEEGEVFFGDPAIFEADAVTLPVTIPNGSWQIAAIPAGGWSTQGPEVVVDRVIGYGLALIIGAMAFHLIMAQRRTRQMALHDPLTGLPNRRLLFERLEQLTSLAERSGLSYGVFFIDLDGFKQINDRFGHRAGDQVLADIGHRLQGSVRRSDTVARVGGDEFVVVVPGAHTAAEVQAVAAKLNATVSAPIHLGGHEVSVTGSTGWATFPEDSALAEELVSTADRRMYEAKARQRADGEAATSGRIVGRPA